MIKDNDFKKLIEQYQQGLLKGHARKLMDEWFHSLSGDKVAKSWGEKDKEKLRQKILIEVAASSKEPIPMQALHKKAASPWRTFYRVAAAVVLLVTFAYLLWQWQGLEKPREIAMLEAAATGTIKKVILADGSLIWLKGSSTLTYPEAFEGSERRVKLNGEALFEVAKDPVHPFIIQCGELTARVLGTSFNIKSEQSKIEVKVLTGRVSLSTPKATQAMIVSANETAIFDNQRRQLARVATPGNENNAVIAGTEYDMQFEDMYLQEVLKRVEGKFNVKVLMRNERLGHCMITADFTDQSLERTLSMIAQTLSFEYDIKDSQVTLRGDGCD